MNTANATAVAPEVGDDEQDGEPSHRFSRAAVKHIVTTDEKGAILVYTVDPIRVVDDETGDVLRAHIDVPPVLDPLALPISIATQAALDGLAEGVANAGDAAYVKDPIRDHGAKFDNVTLDTAALQASLDEAAVPEAHEQDIGNGGKVRLGLGIAKAGPLFASRTVGIEGAGGTQGSSIIKADYTSLNGVAGVDAMITLLDDGKKKRNRRVNFFMALNL